MADYVFERGNLVPTGSHGRTDYVFASGEPVPNSGVSEVVFESGYGLGAGQITISDDSGSVTGTVGTIEGTETVENFYDHEPNLYARGDVLNWSKAKTATFMFYRNTSDDTLSLIAIYDDRNSDSGSNLDLDISGIPTTVSFAVTDDLPTTVDSYSLNEPDGSTHNNWGTNRTDGWAIKDLSGHSGEAITIDVTHLSSENGYILDTARGIGPDGEIERPISENTTWTVTLP